MENSWSNAKNYAPRVQYNDVSDVLPYQQNFMTTYVYTTLEHIDLDALINHTNINFTEIFYFVKRYFVATA